MKFDLMIIPPDSIIRLMLSFGYIVFRFGKAQSDHNKRRLLYYFTRKKIQWTIISIFFK